MKHIRTKYADYYVDDKNLRQGKHKWYYEDGRLNGEGYYKDSRWEGECKWYYRNGRIEIECYYKDGKLEGKFKSYCRNGKIEEERFYKNDKEITDPLERFILMGERK